MRGWHLVHQVPSIITMVLPDDVKSLLVKFGLSIALIFTYPIAMFPVFEIVEDRSEGGRGRRGGRESSEKERK